MATVSEQIQEIYIGLLGRAADKEGLEYWTAQVEAGNITVDQVRANVVDSQDEYATGLGAMSREDAVTELYARLFERAPEAAGLEYWVNGEGKNVDVDELVMSMSAGASEDDTAVLANKTAAAEYYTAKAAEYSAETAAAAVADVDATSESLAASKAATDAIVAPEPEPEPEPEPVDGDTFELTSGTDKGADFTGTAGDDLFDAGLVQNPWAGGVSNSLSSADRLDGGAGDDTLSVELVPEFFGAAGVSTMEVQPETKNIENVELEVQDGFAGNTVVFDAKDMTDIEKIGSKQSDGDLVIENLTTLTHNDVARATSDITVTMDHTDNFNSDGDASDLTVYFDEDYLLPTTNLGESSVVFKIMNQDSYDRNDGEMRLDGVYVARMEFELDGVRYDLAPFIDEDAEALGDEFQTEVALVEYLNATALPALAAANPGAADALESLSFSIGNKWNDENQNRIGDEIVLTASNQYSLETRDAWLTIDQAEGVETGYASNRIERTGEYVGQDSEELAVNIELHKVGREGEGGDLVIGGKEQDSNTPDTVEGAGIDIFNVSVLGADNKPSNLGALSSTNDDLDIVNIKTDDAFVNGDTFASLTIRDGFGERQVDGTVDREALVLVDADQFKGDLKLGTDTDVLNLQTLNASGGGDVTFNADVTVDGNYDYNTGSGNDTIKLDIDTESVDRVNTSIAVSTANGDDTVTLNTETDGNASQQTMALFNNMTVDTASGADTVVVTGDGRFNIDAGSDSDFVYINSQGTASAEEGMWAFGRLSDSSAMNPLADFTSQVLYSATLTVVFAGLESTVTIETDTSENFIANQLHINAAIKEAIADSPELSKLLEVTEDDGNQRLNVSSKVDGDNDLQVFVSQPNVYTGTGTGVELSSADVMSLVEGLYKTGVAGIDSDSDATDVANALDASVVFDSTPDGAVVVDGSNATGAQNVNFSVIDMGAGNNDLVVLDSNELSSNTLVINQTFGKVTVVNFHDAAPWADEVPPNAEAESAVGNHVLDFTHYLNNKVDSSNNSNNISEAAVAVTLNTSANGDSFAANSVNIISGVVEDVANGETFASMTAGDLLKALNGDVAYANFQESNPTSTADLVGSTQNHIVMIEDPHNDGEYRVFHLTSTLDGSDNTTGANGDADNDNADFATAVELGTLDFGDSINSLSLDNLAGSASNMTGASAQHAAIVSADGGVVTLPTYSVAADAASADEGSTATFTLTTTDVAEGTEVTYSLSGVDAADVDALSGTATVGADGTATISVALTADETTEGEETLTVTAAGSSASITVNDTSVNVDPTAPTYSVAANAASADEGATAAFTLTTTNVAEGTEVAYTLSGVDAADVDALSGTVIVGADGTAAISVALTADEATEGDETLTVTVEGETASITVNDTSVAVVTSDVSIDQGTAQAAAALDAAADNFKYTDDASVENFVEISNFASGDMIEITNATAGDYSINNNGADVTLTYNNAGTVNSIKLVGVVDANSLIFSEDSLETALGFDAIQFA